MKYYGVIGYAMSEETSPGVWVQKIIEKKYYCDITRNARRISSGDKINDSIDINNTFSIISDPFGYQNFHSIVYISYMGSKWKVTNVEVAYPRLILTVGGLYNEE